MAVLPLLTLVGCGPADAGGPSSLARSTPGPASAGTASTQADPDQLPPGATSPWSAGSDESVTGPTVPPAVAASASRISAEQPVSISACGRAGSGFVTGHFDSSWPPAQVHSAALDAQAAAAADATARESARLLSMVQVPSGSGPGDPVEPDDLFGSEWAHRWDPPPLSISVLSCRVPLPVAQSVLFLHRFAPPGTPERPETSTPDGVLTSTDSFTEPAGAGWAQGSIDYEVVDNGDRTTTWTVSVQLQRRDPRPELDISDGPRFDIGADGACPSATAHRDDVAPDDPAPGPTPSADGRSTGTPTDGGTSGAPSPDPERTSLVPAGAPTGALLCRYATQDPTPGRLLVAHRLEAAAAGRLAAAVRAVSLQPDWYVHTCPGIALPDQVVVFRYADGRVARLWVPGTGCRVVSNGRIVSTAAWDLARLIDDVA